MKKLVLEMSFYTDGDWGFGDISWLTEHTSRYFDNDFYEYTNRDEDGYRLSFRRVFDIIDDTAEVMQFFNRFTTGLHGRKGDLEYVSEFLDRAKEHITKHALTSKSYGYYDYLDGNTEADITINMTDKDVLKIKEIIYEG